MITGLKKVMVFYWEVCNNVIKVIWRDKMPSKNDTNNAILVKRIVILVVGIAGLILMAICAKNGYKFGEVLGELIYNLKH